MTPDQFVHSTVPVKCAVIYVPSQVEEDSEIAVAADRFCAELLQVSKHVIGAADEKSKVFVITSEALGGENPTALAHSALIGLSRIIASEHPDQWGALVDIDSTLLPLQAIKYVRGMDVIKVEDTVAKVARLRPFPRDSMMTTEHQGWLNPTSHGTYIISGGLGVLGLEVAQFLIEKGARRLVLLSRRSLPPRSLWGSDEGPPLALVKKIEQMESSGASIFILAIDITKSDAKEVLLERLNDLMLPPVSGVVHAAGVLEDQMVRPSSLRH